MSTRGIRWILAAGAVVALESIVRVGLIEPSLVPPPSLIFQGVFELLGTGAFYSDDLRATVLTVLIAFAVGLALGVPAGIALWRVPLLAKTFEMYFVAMYAMPVLIFYPVLLSIFGLGLVPVILIASFMAFVPISLQVMAALGSVSPVLPKLARSMCCTGWSLYGKVLIPAAAPVAVTGFRLGFIYATIGTIAMEFMTASQGLGFGVGQMYREFEVVSMYAYVVVIAGLAIAGSGVLARLEKRLRRDMFSLEVG